MRRAAVWVLLGASAAMTQMQVLTLPPDAMAPEYAPPANLDFEKGTPGQLPPEWSLAQESRIAGYTAEWRSEGCRGGRGCAVVIAGPHVENRIAGALVQQCSALPYRGKRMRLRAWVKLGNARKSDRIKVIFTTDGESSAETFVQKGGVNAAEWTLAEVDGKVPMRADEIHLVVTMTGKGQAWIDDVAFEEVR